MTKTRWQEKKEALQAEALEKYVGYNAEIQAMLEKILEASKDHFENGPDEITYAHVGTIAHWHEQVKDLHDQVFRTGEYDPSNC